MADIHESVQSLREHLESLAVYPHWLERIEVESVDGVEGLHVYVYRISTVPNGQIPYEWKGYPVIVRRPWTEK